MEEKKEIDLFELRDLVLGMTVYHPNAGGGKVPMVLNGIRLHKLDTGTCAQVELLYSDGNYMWADISGLSTIPEYGKKKDAMDYAYDIKEKLSHDRAISDVSIGTLADIVIALTKDVQGAKGW